VLDKGSLEKNKERLSKTSRRKKDAHAAGNITGGSGPQNDKATKKGGKKKGAMQR